MAKKSDDKAPGYDATGYRGAAPMVKMTYRIGGLADNEQRQKVIDHLWSIYKRGTDAQRATIGPRCDGADVTYTFLTFLGAAEEAKTADLKVELGNLLNRPAKLLQIAMTHEPAPEAPPPLAGVDAPPAVVAKAANR